MKIKELSSTEYIIPGTGACAGCPSTIGLRIIGKALGENAIGILTPSCAVASMGLTPQTCYTFSALNICFASAGASAGGAAMALDALYRKGKLKVEVPVLQNRWRLEGKSLKYYGFRNYPYTLHRTIKLSSPEVELIHALDGDTSLEEINRKHRPTRRIQRLFKERVIVDISQRRSIPGSLEEARYCVCCAANDYMFPGLEFDSRGNCALCQAEEKLTGDLSTPLLTLNANTIRDTLKGNESSRFDVALLYTGGKDSSYLLYYLAKVCSLRVLACTWSIPFMSPNARANIQAARERLTNVEFVERSILPRDLEKMYKASLKLQGNTCLCPSLAYVIFYPMLAAEKVPYIVSGVEEAQHKNMIYNGFIPLRIYKLAASPAFQFALNLFRVLTLRPPYKKGQLASVTYLRQLAFKNNFQKKIFGYNNEMVEHLNAVFNKVPEILAPLKHTLRKIDRSRNIPVMVNIDFNSISPGGAYDWKEIKKLITEELGWQGTGEDEKDKGLHTSCIVEDGKDYAQFIRFRNMESMLIPFSSVELSAAVLAGNITREEAMAEQRKMPGFNLEPPRGYKLMQDCDGLPCRELCGVYDD